MTTPQATTLKQVRDSIATFVTMAGLQPVWLYDVANPPEPTFPFVGLHLMQVRTAEQPELFHDNDGVQSSRILHVGQVRIGCYSQTKAGAGSALDMMDDLLGVFEFLSIQEMFQAAGIGAMGRERIVHNPYVENNRHVDRCTIEIYFSWCTVRSETVGYIDTVLTEGMPVLDEVVLLPGEEGGEGAL